MTEDEMEQKIDFDRLRDISREYGIKPRLEKLPRNVWGITYQSSRDRYYILIDKNLTRETQQKILCHELYHIMTDLHELDYYLGIDMHLHQIERDAEEVAKAAMETKYKEIEKEEAMVFA